MGGSGADRTSNYHAGCWLGVRGADAQGLLLAFGEGGGGHTAAAEAKAGGGGGGGGGHGCAHSTDTYLCSTNDKVLSSPLLLLCSTNDKVTPLAGGPP
jgi:hypothetical protein